MRKVFVLAGEMSGDAHGAGLIRAIQASAPQTQFLGLGGPLMRKDGGGEVTDWAEEAGVVGLWEVLKMYGWFKKKLDETLVRIATEKPDAVILIDYPGFNLRLAKAIRTAGIPTKILYYISPQVWAWKRGRIKTMAQVLDLMICIFPFEKDLYEKSGLRTVFAGHPMVDHTRMLSHPQEREPGLVGLFPGSRKHEVRRIFPTLLDAALQIRKAFPQTRFVISAANPRLAAEMREIIAQSSLPEAGDWIGVGNSKELMQRAAVGVVASGTATMEAACLGMPYILVYRVNLLTYVVGKLVVRIQYLGIINVLARREVVKELIQQDMTPEKISAEVLRLLQNKTEREALMSELAKVVATLGEGGAYQRAAAAVLSELPQP